MEARLGRSLSNESNARPLVWGNTLESFAFELLPFGYELTSQETIKHPTISHWSGSADGTAPDTVFDIKCPMTLKAFCQLVDSDIEQIKESHKDYYWQLVSNSILTNSKYAELIVFVPYLSQLPDIRQHASLSDNAGWIEYAADEELPYLIDGGHYKNLNIIRFEVPQADKDFLTDCVVRAGKLLSE